MQSKAFINSPHQHLNVYSQSTHIAFTLVITTNMGTDNTSRYPLSALLGVVLSSSVTTTHAADAADAAPDIILQQTSSQMLASLKQHRSTLKENPKYIFDIVTNVLVPHIDIQNVSRVALGKHWRKATRMQRYRFTEEFQNLLVRFYSLALVEYFNVHDIPDDVIEFIPLINTPPTSNTTVHTKVKQQRGRPVNVAYNLHQVNDTWMVYDVAVEGISIISAYRSVFASELRGKDIEELISSMAEHNQKLIGS